MKCHGLARGYLLYGGALVSLADTAVVMAIKSVIPAEAHFVTVSLKADFLRAVKQGVVTARAKATHQGGISGWGKQAFLMRKGGW